MDYTNINTQPPFFIKFIRFFFNGLIKTANLTRHALLLLIFIIIVSFFWSGEDIELLNRTALIIAPEGNVVNQYSGTPSDRFLRDLQGADIPETQLRDIISAIDNAANDHRISVLVLSPDYMWSIGLADLAELESAVQSFKKVSGKPVIAIAQGMSQNQYYFASLADEIILDPQGMMFFQGYGNYRNYFKEGLDKLGIDVHLFRVGEYKSAAEPFIRNDMSIEAKESALHYMSDLWETYLAGIAEHRKLSVEDVKSIIENQTSLLKDTDGNIAQMYKDAGMVDQLMNSHFKAKYLAGLSASENSEVGFRNIGMFDYNLLISQEASDSKNLYDVAVVVAQGTILDGEQEPGTIGGVSTSRLLSQARQDRNVKAVVLRVDSGGGSVFASEQIRREIDALKVAGKPVVVSMGNVAASGGYWISMTSDRIFANDATITGSIGIFGMFMTYPKTLDKIGVHTDGVGTSSWSGAFRPDRELNEDLAELIQSNIEYGYQQFITAVALSRSLEVDMVDAIARGRVWTAKQAKEFGLIDEIGGLSNAIEYAAEKAGIGSDYHLKWIEPELSSMDRFFMNGVAKVSEIVGVNLFSQQSDSLHQLLQPLQESLKLVLNTKSGVPVQYAHCFCEVKQ